MRILELFSGTGSVGNVCRELGMEVVSLDRDMDADIKTDIMDWDYLQLPCGHFDVIWASPPCTEYSIAKTVGVRKIDAANDVVRRTLTVIRYFDPTYWIMENPQTGLLKNQEFMADLSYYDVDYCKYGMPYRKRTRLWHNLDCWTPRPLCMRDCGGMNDAGTKHRTRAQRSPSGNGYEGSHHSVRQLYRVPPELIREIMTAITQT